MWNADGCHVQQRYGIFPVAVGRLDAGKEVLGPLDFEQ